MSSSARVSGSGSGYEQKVPATVVACAAVVAVVGPGFCRGATCLVRSSISLVASGECQIFTGAQRPQPGVGYLEK